MTVRADQASWPIQASAMGVMASPGTWILSDSQGQNMGSFTTHLHWLSSCHEQKLHISWYLANKHSIASRIDCFSEVSTSVFGENLLEQVEEQLSFYETEEIPRKNVEVTKEAMGQAEEAATEITRKLEKHLK